MITPTSFFPNLGVEPDILNPSQREKTLFVTGLETLTSEGHIYLKYLFEALRPTIIAHEVSDNILVGESAPLRCILTDLRSS